jgi:hypothetical protein
MKNIIYVAGRPHLEQSDINNFDQKFFLKSSALNSDIKLWLIVKFTDVCMGEKVGLK